MFGKPLVGNPIAAEHIRALPMTSRFGCGLSMLAPTCCTIGSIIKAATVWLINVAMTKISPQKTTINP